MCRLDLARHLDLCQLESDGRVLEQLLGEGLSAERLDFIDSSTRTSEKRIAPTAELQRSWLELYPEKAKRTGGR